MQFVDIFYSIFWVSCISIVWFCTDWLEHYMQLLNVFEKARIEYAEFVTKNPEKYFPDFLYTKTKNTKSRIVTFILKLQSCPFCLVFWLSVFASLLNQNVLFIAPIYVISLFIVLEIKKLM